MQMGAPASVGKADLSGRVSDLFSNLSIPRLGPFALRYFVVCLKKEGEGGWGGEEEEESLSQGQSERLC